MMNPDLKEDKDEKKISKQMLKLTAKIEGSLANYKRNERTHKVLDSYIGKNNDNLQRMMKE